MSEGFLTRWSRLKREREQSAAEAPAPSDASVTPASVRPAAVPPAAVQDTQEAASAQSEAPAVDLDALPNTESITADTDIRAFLAPGIPAHLTRAALRRVWSADPAIRDFVGLSENAWDFNDPASVPGFGPAVPPEDVKRLLAEIMGDDRSDPPALAQGESSLNPDNPVPACEKPAQTEVPALPTAESPIAVTENDEPRGCAAQDEPAQEPAVFVPHRHGGALPS